ncbi:MAG: DMT family transporter [Lachnospiraceae bacterium]|nr:DMT family transporter [Lachnospiraceae bacterium]
MDKFIIKQSGILLLTAVIWGVAFAAQSAGMDYVGPFTFNAVRSLIGGVVLIPCICILDKWKKKNTPREQRENIESNLNIENKSEKKSLIIGGAACGVFLFVASNFQQFGIQYTTVGKAGFVTALYIILVPIFGIFLHRKVSAKIWIGVAIALLGLYLLCMQGSFQLQKGDFLVLLCAFSFSFHILVVDYFSPKTDGVKMSCIQFFVCGVLSAVCMFLFETPKMGLILEAWLPILYAGVLSCGVAYTLQIVGQKGMNPTVASLILSLESVVSVLAGWVILHETLSKKELLGCVLMFVAIILAQLPDRKREEGEK